MQHSMKDCKYNKVNNAKNVSKRAQPKRLKNVQKTVIAMHGHKCKLKVKKKKD